MGVYDRQIAGALRTIKAKGEACLWQQRGASGGTAAKPGAGTVIEKAVNIAFFPINLERVGTNRTMILGTEVPGGYLIGYMGHVDFTPTQKDTVKRASGEILEITDKNGIELIDPNGEGVILYTIRFIH